MNNREWKLKSWFFLLFFTSCTSINTTTADHYLIFVHRLFFSLLRVLRLFFVMNIIDHYVIFGGWTMGWWVWFWRKRGGGYVITSFFKLKKWSKINTKAAKMFFLNFFFKNRKWCRHCLRFVSVSVSSIVFSLLTSFCEPHLVPLQPQILRQIWPLSCWSCFCFGPENSLKPS